MGDQELTEAAPDIDHIIRELEAGLVPQYGDGYEIELRQKILERIDRLKDALRMVTPPKHGQIGHNHPPPDEIPRKRSSSHKYRPRLTFYSEN